MGDPVDADPSRRLHAACLAAIERVEHGPSHEMFASLGESLFWLIALAEAKGRRRGSGLLLGLAWARNRIAHGVILAEPVRYHRPFAIGQSALGGPDVLGGGYVWLGREAIVSTRTQRADAAGEEAYDTHLAGRPVLSRLRDGLAEATP